MWGYLHAIKHANGKDWWIVDLKMTILGGSKTSEHQIIKLDQNGAQKSSPRTLVLFYYNSSASGVAKFSPDGQKWVYYCPLDGLWFLDFDREKEEFSITNFTTFVINFILLPAWNGRPITDSFTSVPVILCFNTIPGWKTWVASEKLVDIWDGSNDPLKLSLQNAVGTRLPNLLSSLSSTKSIHVINNPDEAAPFVILYNTISSYSHHWHKGMPTFPNYRLDSGPVCDPTITTSSKISLMFLYYIGVGLQSTNSAFLWKSAYQYRNAEIKSWIQMEPDGRDRMNRPSLSTLIAFGRYGIYIGTANEWPQGFGQEKLVVVRVILLNMNIMLT